LDFYDLAEAVYTGQTLAVLKPKPELAGRSWKELVVLTEGRIQTALASAVG